MKAKDLYRKALTLVRTICGNTAYYNEEFRDCKDSEGNQAEPDVPLDNAVKAAYELLSLFETETGKNGALIFEIPLCWDNQVVIRYTLGDYDSQKGNWWSKQAFDFSAGISINKKDFFVMVQWEPIPEAIGINEWEPGLTPFYDGMATLFSMSIPLSDFLSEDEIRTVLHKRDLSDVPILHYQKNNV